MTRMTWTLALCLVLSVCVLAFATPAARAGEYDHAAAYRAHGHQGPWSDAVAHAIALHAGNTNDVRIRDGLLQAWKDGCRDPLVAYILIRWYRKSPNPQRAQEYWDALQKEAPVTYPGGLYRHGMCPHEMAIIALRKGHREQAEKDLSAALAAANAAKAPRGAAAVRLAQLYLLNARDPNAALALWTEHATELRSVRPALRDDPFEGLVHLSAASLPPQRIVDFLRSEPPGEQRDKWLEFYTQQSALAAESAREQTPARHRVLVEYHPALRGIRADLGHYQYFPLSEAPFPVVIRSRVRLGGPEGVSPWTPLAEIRTLARPDTPGLLGWILGAAGQLYPVSGTVDGESLRSPLNYIQPDTWHELEVVHDPRLSEARLDGVPVRRIHYRPRGIESVTPSLHVRGTTADFEDLCVYTTSDTPADNDAIRSALRAFQAAMQQCDPAAARPAVEQLASLWGPIPQAGAFLQRARAQLARVDAIATDAGLDLATADTISESGEVLGKWSLRDGALLAVCCHPGHEGHDHPMPAALRLPVVTGNFELSGIVEIPMGAPEQEPYVTVSWNTSAKHASENRLIFRPHTRRVLLCGSKDSKKARTPAGGEVAVVPFCLRVRNTSAALFVEDPERPLLVVTDAEPLAHFTWLRVYQVPQDKAARFRALRLRRLPPDRDLHAPAILPEMDAGDASDAGGTDRTAE